MNTDRYNDEMIRQYLLGVLSEEETERLDELSIADDGFVERLDTLENDLVDAYVRGELSGKTLERFRSFYLSSPRRSERVRFAKAFQNVADRTVVSGMTSRQRGSSEGLIGEKPVTRRPSRFLLFPRPVLLWATAIAALLVVTVGLAVVNLRLREQMNAVQSERAALEQRDRELQSQLAEERSSASQQDREIEGLRDKVAHLEQRVPERDQSLSFSEPPNIESFVLSPQTRGGVQIPALQVPTDADYVSLRLELESGDYRSYRANLKSLADSRVVWSSGRLRAKTKDDRRVIEVALRAKVLKPHRYILEVSGVSASGAQEPAGSYAFRVEKR